MWIITSHNYRRFLSCYPFKQWFIKPLTNNKKKKNLTGRNKNTAWKRNQAQRFFPKTKDVVACQFWATATIAGHCCHPHPGKYDSPGIPAQRPANCRCRGTLGRPVVRRRIAGETGTDPHCNRNIPPRSDPVRTIPVSPSQCKNPRYSLKQKIGQNCSEKRQNLELFLEGIQNKSERSINFEGWMSKVQNLIFRPLKTQLNNFGRKTFRLQGVEVRVFQVYFRPWN